MKLPVLKLAIAALALAGSAPAFANLIPVTGVQTNGTGLGAVSTVVTAMDNTVGNQSPVTESGCVTYNGDLNNPSFACQEGLLGGDNQAINRMYLASSIDNLTTAANLALMVNVSEPDSTTATLTKLYLSLYNLDKVGSVTGPQMNFAYTGGPLEMLDSGGVGQSGINLFTLDAAQAATAAAFCPDLQRCVIGGGMQFLAGTTQGSHETMYVASYNPVPEPFSLALIGAGLFGIGVVRRTRQR